MVLVKGPVATLIATDTASTGAECYLELVFLP